MAESPEKMKHSVRAMADREGKYLTLSGYIHLGCVVDAVSEVINISSLDIEDPPDFGVGLDSSYILGMGKMEGGVKILPDIDHVLSIDEVSSLSQTAYEN
ncbi:chemotaxis protein CheW [Desulfobacula phenolica]|uniref:Purine-binding chemotaxis protein CheW n=1 Tax=Desulfobacula phenolica TaxID=90732 RepID=A0A1H2E0Y1_9BACT|nr:chemotaxis protein CheW [Desulfobacula phenolica]SDT88743.1 purine-binding chemotaxis protein CheW [Desulfobacula phenolica]